MWVSTYTSYLLYKVQDPFSACRQSHGQNRFSVYFLGRTSLCFTDQETQEENMLMDKLPCGSVLTPVISCTKFKIHLAHADSPMSKTGFSVYFLGRTSLCFTDQETQEENVLGGPTPLWVSTYTSYLLCKVQDPFNACRQSHGQNRLSVYFLGRTSLCFKDQETQEENVLGGQTPLWVSTYTSYLLYEVQGPFNACRQSHGQNRFSVYFLGRTSLCFIDQETQEENMLMYKLPCGSVLPPVISCTKFKIHLAHTDSPMSKTGFSVYFLGRTSLCFTDQETQEENVLGGPTPLWVSTYTSYLLCKVQDPFSACRQSQGQNRFSVYFLGRTSLCFTDQETQEENMLMDKLPCGSVLTPVISCTKFKIHLAHADSPMSKTGFSVYFLGRTSLCFTDQETQEENVLGGPTPLWVSTYTSYLLCKVQDPFSACRQSHGQNRFSVYFLGRTSLCFTDQETQEENVLGGQTPLWVSTYTSYLLYEVQGPFSACRQSHGQNRFSVYFLGRTSLCFIDQETQEENMLMYKLPCGSVLPPVISCTKFKIHLAHTDSPMSKTGFSVYFLGRTSLCFTDQETQEENVLGGPTPLWVSTYTSYLLYKVQDPFSACRQSHGQNRFFCLFFREDQSLLHRPRNSGREYVDGPTPLWVCTYTSYLLYKVQDSFSACRQSHGQNRFSV